MCFYVTERTQDCLRHFRAGMSTTLGCLSLMITSCRPKVVVNSGGMELLPSCRLIVTDILIIFNREGIASTTTIDGCKCRLHLPCLTRSVTVSAGSEDIFWYLYHPWCEYNIFIPTRIFATQPAGWAGQFKVYQCQGTYLTSCTPLAHHV